jgi:SulP family sulfate permease
VDLTVAIAVGVVLASILFMNQMSQAQALATSGNGAAENTGRNVGEDAREDDQQRADLPPGVEVFRMVGPFFFGVASQLVDTLRRMGQKPKVMILRLREVPFLDATGASALQDFARECRSLGIHLVLAGTAPQPLRLLTAVGLGPESALVVHSASYAEALRRAETLRTQAVTSERAKEHA